MSRSLWFVGLAVAAGMLSSCATPEPKSPPPSAPPAPVVTAPPTDEVVMIGKDKLWDEPRPDAPDLSVQYISRTPRYPGLKPTYVRISNSISGFGDTGPITFADPNAQRWPKPRQEVTYTAVVRNTGTRLITRFDYAWLYDGRDVQIGVDTHELKPGDTVSIALKRPWQDGAHAIAFQVDRHGLIDEQCEQNNWVIDRTDGLALAFFVEESVQKYFQSVRSGLGSYDWADWAQFQIRQMNKEFRDTIYPSCPEGISERVRLDAVYVIPDGWGHKLGTHVPGLKLPANLDAPEFYNANQPPPGVKFEGVGNMNSGFDGTYGFTADLLKRDPNTGLNRYAGAPRWLTGSEWLVHQQLGHQLGRADHNLIGADPNSNVALPGIGYVMPPDYQTDMMYNGKKIHDEVIGKNHEKWDSTYHFYSEHVARSFNRDKGVRRGLFGEYFFDIPTKNTFTFVTLAEPNAAGGPATTPPVGLPAPAPVPVGSAEVQFFVGLGDLCYFVPSSFRRTPNFTGRSDTQGRYTLARNPWEHVFVWGNNGVVMFIVTPPAGAPQGAAPLYGFVDISQFNLEYWRGHARDATYTVKLQPVPESALHPTTRPVLRSFGDGG